MFNVCCYFTVSLLTEQQPLLVSAAIKGISLIGSSTPLPLQEAENTTKPDSDSKMEVDGIF